MAGVEVERGTVSTTDWSVTTPSELARALEQCELCEDQEASDNGPGFFVVFGRDADRTPVMEMLCDTCGGAGHPKRLCPSSAKFRSHSYLIELHTSAKERKDSRGQRGGARATVRGQKPPFSPQQPRTFSPNARTSRANTPRRYYASRQAEELEEDTAETVTNPAETITSRSASTVGPVKAVEQGPVSTSKYLQP